MKQKLTLLLFALFTTIGGAWATEVTTVATAGSYLTLDQLKALSGTGGHVAFANVGSGNWTNKWLANPSANSNLTLSTVQLYTITDGSVTGKYYLQCVNDNQYRTSSGWGDLASAENIEFRAYTASSTTVACNNPISIHNNSGTQWNINAGSFGGALNAWAAYAAYGPFYILEVTCIDDETSTTLQTSTQIVTNGHTMAIPTFDGKVLAEGSPASIEISGADATYTLHYVPLPDYTDQVTANIQPFIDNPGTDYFKISVEDAETLNAKITTAKEDDAISLAEYNELLEDFEGFMNYPETGYYRIKSSGARNIGESYIGYGSSDYGTGFRTVAAANKLTDISTVIKFTGSNGTYKLSTQGLNVQSQKTANKSFPVASTEGVDFVFSVIPTKPGFVTICNTASVNGNCHGYLHEGGDGTSAKGVVNWQSGATASHWTVEAAEDVTISLTAANDNTDAAHTYATLCVPFEITGLTGADSKEVKAYAPTKDGDFIVPGEGASTVAAGTPVILIGEEGATSVTATIGSDYTNTPATTNILTGTFTDTDIDPSAETGTNYVLGFDDENDNLIGFYHVSKSSITLGANRAYLHIEGADVKGFAINFGDDATSINELRMKSEESGAAIYNLAGQRISKVQKGVNIMNGKKVMVK